MNRKDSHAVGGGDIRNRRTFALILQYIPHSCTVQAIVTSWTNRNHFEMNITNRLCRRGRRQFNYL